MKELLFHIGMGKTGTSSIQYALESSTDALQAAATRYLGMWMGLLGPRFDGFAGFQDFLLQPAAQMVAAADAFADALERDPACLGFDRFLVSNEQYLENGLALVPFFRRLSERAGVRFVIYARAPESWLPSACAQWGLVHKTNKGRIQAVSVLARRLIRQYDSIRHWHEAFGANVTLRVFDPRLDVLADFGDLIGVALHAPVRNLQARPSLAELLIRAAFNNSRPGMSLPDDFDRLKLEAQPPGSALGLSDKFRRAFDYSEIPVVIAERAAEFDYIEQAFGVALRGGSQEPSPAFDPAALSDEVIGSLLDIVGVQEARLNQLRVRIDRLEKTIEAGRVPT